MLRRHGARFCVAWLLLTFVSVVCAFSPPLRRQRTQAGSKPDQALPNFHVSHSNIATCGQPTEEGFRQLKQKGYKTVINLRTAAEGAEKEQPLIENLGLKYVNIPISSDTLGDQAADTFREVMRNRANQPVLVHCASANRVGGLMIIYFVLDQQMSLEEAEKKAAEIGFLGAPWLRNFVLDYIHRHKS